MAHTPQSELNTSNAAAAVMPDGLQYSDRCDWIAKRNMLAQVAAAAPEVATADFETTITVVIERGLIFVVIDDNVTEKNHRVMDAEEIARIAHKHGVVVGNVYFEKCSDGFIRRVRTLITTSAADTAALMEIESAAGCTFFEKLDRAADIATVAPKPIWINSPQEAAFAATCLKRRITAAHFVA